MKKKKQQKFFHASITLMCVSTEYLYQRNRERFWTEKWLQK